MRHRKMLAPINSIKHYVQRANVGIASGAGLTIPIVTSVAAPATASTDEVKQGAVVKAVYLEYWLLNTGVTAEETQFVVALEKVPGGASGAMSVTDLLNLGAYDNKKNILFTSQGILHAALDGVNAIPIIRSWVMIPKGKQRFGLNDILAFSLTSVGQTLNVCGFATYKEYY